MNAQATVPDLDAECDYLIGEGPNADGVDAETAVERITDDAAGEYGLQLRYWERGEGEWFWYVLQEGDAFACFNPGNGATDTYTDASEVAIAVGVAEDVDRVPRKRLPKWGDWSAYRSCTVCRGALRETDSVGTRDGYAHEECK